MQDLLAVEVGIELEIKAVNGLAVSNHQRFYHTRHAQMLEKLLKHSNFVSIADLKAKVLAVLENFNGSIAKPFK